MTRALQLQKQWALFDRQEFERAFAETHAVLSRLQGEDLRDAQRLMGLCCYLQQQYSVATFWFKKACQGSEQSSDWLNLALAATLHGDLELGAQAFEQARLCQQVARFRQVPGFYLQAFWYATALCDASPLYPNQNVYPRVELLLNELAAVYKRLRCTDTAFVYSHELPFLVSFLELVVRCFRAQEKYAQGIAWLQELGDALDEEGKRQVSKAMAELRL